MDAGLGIQRPLKLVGVILNPRLKRLLLQDLVSPAQGLHQGHMLPGAILPGGEDQVGVPEQLPKGVLDAGEFRARHGVAADEVYALR
jgi:hypothetical protein